jgi:hypothetical protein
MSKQWPDWSELYKTGHVEQSPEAEALSKAITPGKGADVISQQFNEALSKPMESVPQPTNEQLFGHLVTSPEQLEKMEKTWDNRFNDFFSEVRKPVETQSADKSWGSRGPIWEETLTEEEQRIRAIKVDERDSD